MHWPSSYKVALPELFLFTDSLPEFVTRHSPSPLSTLIMKSIAVSVLFACLAISSVTTGVSALPSS